MAISQSICNSFRQQCMLGQHDLVSNVIKIALYTSLANLDATTTVYTSSNEVSGAGYATGGSVLTGATVLLSGSTAYANFATVTWPLSAITARGALIYNSTSGNKAIAVLDFGADKVSQGGTFTVVFPPNDVENALIRLL